MKKNHSTLGCRVGAGFSPSASLRTRSQRSEDRGQIITHSVSKETPLFLEGNFFVCFVFFVVNFLSK